MLEQPVQALAQGLHLLGVKDRAAQVQHQGPTWRQYPLHALQGCGLVQRACRCIGVGQIQHQQIKLLCRLVDEGHAIANLHMQAAVLPHIAVHRFQPCFAGGNHRLIQLRQHHTLQGAVFEQLLGQAAIAAANDQRLLGVRVRNRGGVRHALMVETHRAHWS